MGVLTTMAAAQKYNCEEGNRKKSKHQVIGIWVFVAVVVAAVCIMLCCGSLPPDFTIKEGTLTISGMFGETVDLSDITSATLEYELPGNLSKANGFDLDHILKGAFRSNGSRLTLFVDESNPPFIYLYTADRMIILNDCTAADTQALYEQLQASLQ